MKTIFIPFFMPMTHILPRIERAFQASPIVRVRGFPIPIVCLRDPAHIEILLNHPVVGQTKYPFMLPRVRWVMRKGGFIHAGGPEWQESRAQLQTGFRRPNLASWQGDVFPFVSQMLDGWMAHAASHKPFDIYHAMRLLVTRINFVMFFSKDLTPKELAAVAEQTHFMDTNFVDPLPLGVPVPSALRFRRYARALRERMSALISERRAHPSGQEDALDHLLHQINAVTGQPWSDDKIVDEIFSIYFGANVMATSLTWAIFLVASHPDVQEKLVHEIQTVLKGNAPTMEDLLKLKYAQAVLKETLRLYPASWGYPRFCKDGMHIEDCAISPRTLVIPMIYWTHRDTRYWPEPSRFLPERFLTEGHGTFPPYSYLPFSAGPRTCLGAGLAPLIMQTILTLVFQRHRLSFCAVGKGEPKVTFGFGIHPRDEVLVSIP